MKILDFFTRCIFIPGIFLFIFSFIPEAVKDVKEWSKLLQPVGKPTVKKKAVRVTTVAPVQSSDSFLYSQIPKTCDKHILSHP